MSSQSAAAEVNWGIVGLGDVTLQKSGPAFYKANRSNLVAVMRRTPGKAQAWVQHQQLLETCQAYDNFAEFVKHPGLNAVYIATPPGAHLEVARHVADAGLAAYVEKPVGRCAWETQAMVDLFESKGLPFYTAYISRAYERTQAVRTLLQQGAIGSKVTSISYTLKGTGGARGKQAGDKLPWRLRASESGGGLIMDVGCHLIDRIDYLFGPLVNVEGDAANRNSPFQDVEDYFSFRAEIGKSSWASIPSEGAAVECTWDFAAQKSLDELVVEGPKGSLQMAAMSPSLPIHVRDSKGKIVNELTFEAPAHSAQPLIQYINNELSVQQGDECISRGCNAVRTSKVLDAVLSRYYGGRDDEFWLRPHTWPGRQNNNGF